MKSNIWAIGDIHGCYDELMNMMALLEKDGLDYEKDTVVFMGDYMDRGYKSREVVKQLIKWKSKYKNFIFLYGNHEDIFKNFIEGGQKYQENAEWSCFFANGGKETMSSYGIDVSGNKINTSLFPKSHLDFLLNKTKMIYETDSYVFVHGGLVPQLPISQHLTQEVYKNAMLWARNEFIESEFDWGKKVIFGHSPASKPRWGKFGHPIVMHNKIGIDGAVCPSANKNLIAVKLPEEKFYLTPSTINRVEEFLIKQYLENAGNL